MLKSPDETVPPQEEAIHRDALGILLRRMRKKIMRRPAADKS